MNHVVVGSKVVGPEQPIFVVAEIGINHNGDVEIAKRLIDVAVSAGCDAVKFQKRTPEICVPPEQRDLIRETPWGVMTYLAYKERTEFGEAEYREIDSYARDQGIQWFASPWDLPSLEFLQMFGVPAYKVASACLTDEPLLKTLAATGKPIFVSTGMSTLEDVDHAMKVLQGAEVVLMHTTSTYPCPPEEVNLRTMETLVSRYGSPVGYSGHERGIQVSLAASALGAVALERHITLDRTMWGSDHAASLEPQGIKQLVRDVRIIEAAMGDGVKRVFPGEVEPRRRLRPS